MTGLHRPTLTKQRLTRAIRRQTNLTHGQVATVIDAFVAHIVEELAAGGRVEIENFLTLRVVTRARKAPYANATTTYNTLKCTIGKRLRQKLRQYTGRS